MRRPAGRSLDGGPFVNGPYGCVLSKTALSQGETPAPNDPNKHNRLPAEKQFCRQAVFLSHHVVSRFFRAGSRFSRSAGITLPAPGSLGSRYSSSIPST